MKKWTIFNLFVLLTVASQMLSMPPAAASVAKLASEDEINAEMNAANNAAIRADPRLQPQAQAPAIQTYRASQQPVVRSRTQTPVPERRATPVVQAPPRRLQPAPRPVYATARTSASPVAQTAPQPWHAPIARQAVQQQVVAANAEPVRQPRTAAPAPQPQYPQAPVEQQPLTRNYDFAPRRSMYGITLIPTLTFGMDGSESDYVSSTSVGGSLSHSEKFVFGGGLMAEFGHSMLTFETGLIYIDETVNASYAFNSYQSVTDDATLGYLGVPLLAKLNFKPVNQTSRIHVSAGVIPAGLVYSKFDYSTNTYGTNYDITDPTSAQLGLGGFRPFNVFGTAAIGGDMSVGNDHDVRVELAYRRALMSLTANTNTYSDTFLLNIGFGFGL